MFTLSCLPQSRKSCRAIESNAPNELWVCDLLSRHPTTGKGNKFVFVAIDHYTKWVVSKPLKSKDASSVAKAMKECILDKFGPPKRVLTDQGLEFRSNQVLKFLKSHSIRHDFGTPEHHQTVGAAEKAIQMLFNKLVKLSQFSRGTWDYHLASATCACNISFNRSIETFLFILVNGRKPISKTDKALHITALLVRKETLFSKRDIITQKYIVQYSRGNNSRA